MATSPIYGWAEPDNTDLVKNGALAIRTLGNAIDTTMDTMVAKTIIDAKGDLIAGSAADTALRLAVGSNGETLVADSSASTGLRYTGNYAAGKNLVINGDYGIWQRGTSFTSTNGTGFFGADRWNIYSATTGRTFSRQNTSPSGNTYYTRIQRDSGNTNLSQLSLFYTLESAQSKPLAGKTLTLSFYARAGANFSAASSTMYSPAVYGTGTDQNQISGFTGSASINNQGNVLTTSWQRFTMTGTVNAAATQVGFQLVYTPVGTAGAADYMDIADVQWEIGSVATAFQTATGTLQGELAACQRYYTRFSNDSAFDFFASGLFSSTTQGRSIFPLPVQMRVSPTTLDTGGAFAVSNGTLSLGASSPTIGTATPNAATVYWVTSGATASQPLMLISDNNATTYVGLSSEL